ncbi:MAG: helix-turn-helix domain-containing protein [Deltaproteobacteria bacterium]|nr:helix-turn-helix domain-containing protein [Deltaproteobacteria bacterium]MBW2051389.1 helix-turn-helix domain-containing protein [Deltaproteobacteria bacterium]MBW2142208.1 helix-turn-helix domain-containing protein [Deltaproteobacteria bacterium]MBW2322736.1 helix-turn-helix domain-containing protein [Deltaproteobacteria bacterium]
MRLVKSARLTLKEASVKMGLGYRQSKRAKKRFHEEGAKGLVHGNRDSSRPGP